MPPRASATDVYCLEFAGEDDALAAAEAGAAAVDVAVVAPGLGVARVLDRERARYLALTHRVSALVGRTDASVGSARALLDAAPLDREGTVAVRAVDVRGTAGVDTRAAERALGDVLVERGFAVDLDDPDHELRALFSADRCLLGWLVVAAERGFGDRQPTDRPFFQPGSMDPILARALVNLAGARPGVTLLDPMCGTGGSLVEAGLVGARAVGVDAQAKMVRGTRANVERYVPDADLTVLRGDAARLPLRDDAVDAVVFDAPYGRQSKIAGLGLDDLVGGALAEARRVCRTGDGAGAEADPGAAADAPPGRAVVVGDRSWAGAAEDAGWTVVATFERRVHRSLVRHVVVLR